MAILKSRESLAVKYRPKRLEQFIGQEEILSTLKGQFKSKGGINRSFLIHGPSGCGKCITEDSLILTPKGFLEIKDIIPQGSAEGFITENIQVCNRDAKFETTSHVFYEKTDETYKITTDIDFKIEGTPEHKLLCLDGITPVWKRLDEITDGDYVAIQRGMQLWPNTSPDIASFVCPEFSDSHFSCCDCSNNCLIADAICDKFNPIDYVTCRICGSKLGNLSTHLPLHGITSQQYVAEYQSSITSPAQIYKQAQVQIKQCSLPTVMSEELATLLGYIVSEASIGDRHIKFYNKHPFVIEDFKRLYYELFREKLEATYDENNVCKFQFGSFQLMEFFKWLGITVGHSRVRCIPSVILQSPKHIVSAFLRAYFEGDGGWNGARISAYSSSEKLARQLQVLLLNYGIVSTLTYKTMDETLYWDVNIFSHNIDVFMREIGFITEYKNNQYNIDIKRSTNLDTIPRVGTYLEVLKRKFRVSNDGTYLIDGKQVKISINSRGCSGINWSYPYTKQYLGSEDGLTLLEYFPDEYAKIKYLFESNYFWSKVKKVDRYFDEKLVYDVTLPGTHSFFANGFVNHNTSLARVIAHYLNCENFDTENCRPCGACEYCLNVAQDNHYGSVEELNFSNDRGIDTIRAVIESTMYAPQHNAHVYICDEIQCLPVLSQNTLLKILEEPPEGVVFLLLTTDPQKLLPTIRNRCCSLEVERVDTDTIAKYLLKICKREKRDYFSPKVSPDDPSMAREEYEKAYAIFKNIAMSSNGYVRQALATLEAVLSMVEGGETLDLQDPNTVKKIVGRFNLENPDTEVTIAQYLISGIYSGRYGIALSYALKLAQQSNVKGVIEKVMDYNMQTLYFMVDPSKKLANLCDAYYSSWYNSLVEAVKKPGSLQVTYQAAADLVGIFMELLSQLGLYVHDERRLIVAYTIKMIDAVNKHKHMSYTVASPLHKKYAPEFLPKKKEE